MLFVFCSFSVLQTWWSRRELNSRLTRLPKGFLHAYAAFNLKKTSLRPKQSFRRNLKCRQPADFTSGQPFPACIDARFLPTGKRDGRAALIKQRTRTERSCCNLHCLHLNLGRMFYRGHSFLGVLPLPRTCNRNRCYPMSAEIALLLYCFFRKNATFLFFQAMYCLF